MYTYRLSSRAYEEDMWLKDLELIHILEPIRREKELQQQAANFGMTTQVNQPVRQEASKNGRHSRFG